MTYQLIQASAHQTGLPDKSVHMICTSPPFYGLRVYSGEQMIEWPTVRYSPMPGLPEITIQGCEPGCVHEWGNTLVVHQRGSVGEKSTLMGPQNGGRKQEVEQGAYCIHCGGWRGGLGNEPHPEAFIGHLILVMREMWRILRDDGVAWVNLGDSYNGSGGAGGDYGPGGSKEGQPKFPGRKVGGLKPKDMIQIPARFALAAQADGWYVRSRLPWLKRNGMPDSCTDRPSQVIEDIFLLAKSEKYYFDMQAIKQPVAEASIGRLSQDIEHQIGTTRANGGAKTNGNLKAVGSISGGRNFRSSDLFFKTWQGLVTSDDGEPLAMVVNPKGYSGAHFACWPLEIPLTCIKASCPPDGVVCDPFNGSGTTGRAALQLNRSYIGIDVSQEYLEDLAPERLSNVQIELAFA